MSSNGSEGATEVTLPYDWENSAAAAAAQAAAAKQLGALFGLPRYSGTNAIGQAYTNQLKPGADFMAKRTAQAAYNEGVTNAFRPKSYMPNWAVQQPAAQWTGARPNPATYFPGIRNVSGGTSGSGTNLGFGTVFGSLAPSGQTPGGGIPSVPRSTATNGGTSTPPVFTQTPFKPITTTVPPVPGSWQPKEITPVAPTNTNPFTDERVPWATVPADYDGPPVDQSWLEQLASTPPASLPQDALWAYNPASRPTTEQQLAAAGTGGNYGVPATLPAGAPTVGTPEFQKWVETPTNFIDYQQAYYTQPPPAKQASSYAAPNSGETLYEYVLRTAPETGYPLGSMGSLGMKAQPLLDKGYSYQEVVDRIMRPTAYMTPEEYAQEVRNGLIVIGRD